MASQEDAAAKQEEVVGPGGTGDDDPSSSQLKDKGSEEPNVPYAELVPQQCYGLWREILGESPELPLVLLEEDVAMIDW